MSEKICTYCGQTGHLAHACKKRRVHALRAVDGHGTSPGVRCDIERFEPHGAVALDKPLGSYPRAMLRHESGTVDIVGGTGFKPFDPTPVEVLAVVGLWAMVRNAEAQAPYPTWWHGARVDTSQPYVVQAVLLDYGSGKQ